MCMICSINNDNNNHTNDSNNHTHQDNTPNPRYHILVFSDPTLGQSYDTTVITDQEMFLGNPTFGESIIA